MIPLNSKNLITTAGILLMLLASVVLATQVNKTTYNFEGITTANDVSAYACDVDVFPFAGSSGNLNSKTEATDAQYAAIDANDLNQWETANPSRSDEVFLWLDMKILEDVNTIQKIELTFNGNTDTYTTTHKMYVMKAGTDWTQTAS